VTAPSQPHGAAYAEAGKFTPDAVAGVLGRGGGGFGREQQSYFDHPVLQKPHWSWEITAYFFVGGIAAGSSALALLAQHGGRPEDRALMRNARYTALAGAAVSGALLTADLGRPERFLNMLRIVKLKSPMSVGVYSLLTFSATTSLAALEQLRDDGAIARNPLGWLPRPLRGAAQAASTALMGCYTGVLVSATAIPVWYRGRRQIPAIFALSAIGTACALQNALLALGPPSPSTARRLETLETAAALAEAALLAAYARSAGEAGRPLFAGARGRRLRLATLGLGLAMPAILSLPGLLLPRPGAPHRARTLLGAACALAGGYALRAAVVGAGRDSADDPRATLQQPF
jgi:formate-dependent nitrite reductase membrane component NrfD